VYCERFCTAIILPRKSTPISYWLIEDYQRRIIIIIITSCSSRSSGVQSTALRVTFFSVIIFFDVFVRTAQTATTERVNLCRQILLLTGEGVFTRIYLWVAVYKMRIYTQSQVTKLTWFLSWVDFDIVQVFFLLFEARIRAQLILLVFITIVIYRQISSVLCMNLLIKSCCILISILTQTHILASANSTRVRIVISVFLRATKIIFIVYTFANQSKRKCPLRTKPKKQWICCDLMFFGDFPKDNFSFIYKCIVWCHCCYAIDNC